MNIFDKICIVAVTLAIWLAATAICVTLEALVRS